MSDASFLRRCLVAPAILAVLIPVASSAQTVVAPGSPNAPKRAAVVIGVGDYEAPEIPDLAYAAEDARAFHRFLRSPAAGMGGYPEGRVRLLVDGDATAGNVRTALTTFVREQELGGMDGLVVFIVGNSVPDPDRPGDVYLLAHDSRLDDLPGTAVSMGEVREAVREVATYMSVLFADVSHSAGIGGPGQQPAPGRAGARRLDRTEGSGGGFVAFSGSSATQLSQEGEQFGGGHGVFTHYLLQGLNGEADAVDFGGDGNRVVTLGELLEYTRDRVRRETRNAQIPAISATRYDLSWPVGAVMEP